MTERSRRSALRRATRRSYYLSVVDFAALFTSLGCLVASIVSPHQIVFISVALVLAILAAALYLTMSLRGRREREVKRMVFVASGPRDHDDAIRVGREIEMAGYHVLVSTSVSEDADWANRVVDALKASGAVVAIRSSDSDVDDDFTAELTAAEQLSASPNVLAPAVIMMSRGRRSSARAGVEDELLSDPIDLQDPTWRQQLDLALSRSFAGAVRPHHI